MTHEALSLLFIGVALTVIGMIACRFYRWKRIIAYIPLLLGVSMIYLTTLGPLYQIQVPRKERLNAAVTPIDSLSSMPGKNEGKGDQR